jgi:hypothetical protein
MLARVVQSLPVPKIARASLALPLLVTALFAAPASAVDIEWVTVGSPGNSCDVRGPSCSGGAVAYSYQIAKYETTNLQYAEFLNAVATTDSNGLYQTSMGSGFGGITRSGNSGSFSYSAISGRESMPVNHVSFYSALRFVNWLDNGPSQSRASDGSPYRGSSPWCRHPNGMR